MDRQQFVGYTRAGYYKPKSWGPLEVTIAKVNSHYEVFINNASVELANSHEEAMKRAREHCNK